LWSSQNLDVEPFWRRELSWAGTSAVDITESDKGLGKIRSVAAQATLGP